MTECRCKQGLPVQFKIEVAPMEEKNLIGLIFLCAECGEEMEKSAQLPETECKLEFFVATPCKEPTILELFLKAVQNKN